MLQDSKSEERKKKVNTDQEAALPQVKKDQKEDEKNVNSLFIFPTSESVIFPNVVAPLHLVKESDIAFFNTIYENDISLGLVANKREKRLFEKNDLYSIGISVKVLKVVTFPNDHAIAVLQGESCFKLLDLQKEEDCLKGKVCFLEDKKFDLNKKKNFALLTSLKEVTLEIINARSSQNTDLKDSMKKLGSPDLIVHFIASHIVNFKIYQRLLAIRDVKKRIEFLLKSLLEGHEFNKLKEEIRYKFQHSLSKEQKEIFIRKQIKMLEEELEEEDEERDIAQLLKKSRKKKWSKKVKNHFEEILDQLRDAPFHNPEYSSTYRYAKLLVDIPWGVYSEDKKDLGLAEEILEKSHFGMEKVKERLVEFLAVHMLKKGTLGINICLVGPPGVGKTTIVKALAQALGRKFVKISLAGMHDEARLLGHGRTYVSSKEGEIISALKQAGTANPVILLDEIDKMDYVRSLGPECILPILDPSQQKEFKDNYLEVPFDISKVIFVSTANDVSRLSWPLQDRLEIIELEGYAIEEKIEIAQNYLMPKAKELHGLSLEDFHITKNGLESLIEQYTSESGVRELYRQMSSICRKIAKAKITKKNYQDSIKKQDVHRLLGTPKYEKDKAILIDTPGKAIGLSWSQVGGSVLPIEVSAYVGKGDIILSGQLGKVMQESARVALSLVKTHADHFKIDTRIFKEYDLHIHSGPGSVSKEGPSAGITLAAAIVSLYTQRKVKKKIAMTGEITLQGKVCPVGGIKEKILAAKRSGIESVILNTDNKKHVEEIKKKYLEGLRFHYVDTVDEAFEHILELNPIKNPKKWIFPVQKKN